jgi:large subunit ribosomal protein L23
MTDVKDERLMKILLAPRVTEKSTFTAEKYRQFVFKVMRDATKPDIKKAVEKMFEVEVESVQVLNVRGKKKMFRRAPGKRSDWKKAYVRLKPGFDIDFIGA